MFIVVDESFHPEEESDEYEMDESVRTFPDRDTANLEAVSLSRAYVKPYYVFQMVSEFRVKDVIIERIDHV